MWGIVPYPLNNQSKEERAEAAAIFAESGNLYLPRGHRYLDDFIDEHAAYPSTSGHDDMVDTTALACLRMLIGVGRKENNVKAMTTRFAPPRNTAQAVAPGYYRGNRNN